MGEGRRVHTENNIISPYRNGRRASGSYWK